ncbi:hypothetical protein HFE03_03560 [Paenibacillus sp. EKM102P]|uniref:hypothetical protein n=1 Tax=unclassified Paenibacillus TaxID=185978 RepID=UPI00142D98B1|nr:MULTISPECIES: hypothetical protein [unclassified Paenibacillus]KAF6618287.1 hypothetical protein HFE00_09400 [Paenibacillus sp. EKM101P]KAF6624632.1 hypothetical protein HFE03_03560 [Paenibacillus sp. EKM102P]KAF6635589.1 hypothetical protein HFE01_01470 [Paenibacillus sp. EKM10P]KAF6648701.1 hypothetical protein HFE02_10080 [Paenibacillus sp. EKM11P]
MFEIKLYNPDGNHVQTIRSDNGLRGVLKQARELLSATHPCAAVYKDGLWIKEYSL